MNEYLISSFRQQLKEDPKSRVFLRLAEELRKGEAFAEAVTVCENGLDHHPRYVPALVCLGRCHQANGDLAAAEKAFRKVLETTPDNPHALRGLSQILEDTDRSSEAIPFLETLVILDPDEAVQAKIQAIRDQSAKSEEAGTLEGDVADEDEPADMDQTVAMDPESAMEMANQSIDFDAALPDEPDELPETPDTEAAVAQAMAEFESVVGEQEDKPEAATEVEEAMVVEDPLSDVHPPAIDDEDATVVVEDPLSGVETTDEVPPFEFDLSTGPTAADEADDQGDKAEDLQPPVMQDFDDGPPDLPDFDDGMMELEPEDLEDLEDLDDDSAMEIDELTFENSGPVPETPPALPSLDDAPATDAEEDLATVAIDPSAIASLNSETASPESAESAELDVTAVPLVDHADDVDLDTEVPDIDDFSDLPEISVEDLDDLPDMVTGPSFDAEGFDSPNASTASTASIDDIDREFERAIHEVDEDAPVIFDEPPEPEAEPEPESEAPLPRMNEFLTHALLSVKSGEDYLAELKSEEAVLTAGLKHEKMEHYEEALKLYRFLMGQNPEDTRFREHAERVYQQIQSENKSRRKIRLLSNWNDKLRGGYHVS